MTDPPDTAPGPEIPFARQIADLAPLAEAYYRAVDDLPRIGNGVTFEREATIARLAPRVLALVAEVRRLAVEAPRRIMPRDLGRVLDGLAATVEAQVVRWGWSYVLGADGEAIIQEKLQAHERNRWIPYRRATRAWRDMPGVDGNSNMDGVADQAEDDGVDSLDLPHGTTPEAAGELTTRLYLTWNTTPVLGPALPSATNAEVLALAKASDALRYVVARERSDLTPTPVEPVSAPPLILGSPESKPIVRGVKKPPLTPQQYIAVKALDDAKPGRLKTGLFRRKMKRAEDAPSDPVKVITRLATGDPEGWGSVILLPGKGGAHKGYGIATT